MTDKLKTLEAQLETPEVWSNQKKASELGAEIRFLRDTLEMISCWDEKILNAETAYEIGDEELIAEAEHSETLQLVDINTL